MAKSNKEQTPKGMVERREFLGGASSLAGASLLGVPSRLPWLNLSAASPAEPAPAPEMPATVERRMRRWQEQRWILDAVIDTVGVEWDQGRLGGIASMPDAGGDAAGIRARVRKFNDITREYTRAAVRREKMARQFEQEGRNVAARESYYVAAVLYGGGQWPIFDTTPENFALNEKKVACFAKYIQLADHEIRKVEIPFGGNGKSLPGYLHLPSKVSNGRVPCVISINGMDGFKEHLSPVYGDKLLERGVAKFAFDGPGQGECLVREIHMTAANWMDAGREVLSFVRSQKEIDPDRIAIEGGSFGSFWGPQVASTDSRLAGCAVSFMCLEPGCNTIFNMASPTFKLRFMYMTGYQDEAEFDKFAQSLTLHGVAEKIKCPFLLVAGEDDHLCPIEFGYQFMDLLSVPKQMLVYEGGDHGLNRTTSSQLGPNAGTYVAEWLTDCVTGKPLQTKHMKVDMGGQVRESTFEEARKSLSIFLT